MNSTKFSSGAFVFCRARGLAPRDPADLEPLALQHSIDPAHLHPSSGEPVPSPDDIMLTERLRSAGELVGIPVVDRIVIGRGCFISMTERGLV